MYITQETKSYKELEKPSNGTKSRQICTSANLSEKGHKNSPTYPTLQYIKAWTRGTIKINLEKSSQQRIALTGQSGEAPRLRTGLFTFGCSDQRPNQLTLTGQSGDLMKTLIGAFVVSRVRAGVKLHSPVDPPSIRRSIKSTPVDLSLDPDLSGSFCVI